MRKRERLITVEKSKKIILLDKRGLSEGRISPFVLLLAFLLAVLGIASLIYCLVIALFLSYGTRFFLVWSVIGGFFLLWSALLFHPAWLGKIPKWMKRLFVTAFCIGVLCFGAVEGLILGGFGEQSAPGADYVIVLGAQWTAGGPSYVLQKRLDAAAQYLRDNPDTAVIVSGGQGSNEPISEAQGMKEYLVGMGIEEGRIWTEDASSNTYENLANSASLLDKEKDQVVLVTNNFHIFRALRIARRQGYARLEGLAADSYPAMLPNNLLREFCGVVKDTLLGNMGMFGP